jgi:hypothetical protein
MDWDSDWKHVSFEYETWAPSHTPSAMLHNLNQDESGSAKPLVPFKHIIKSKEGLDDQLLIYHL